MSMKWQDVALFEIRLPPPWKPWEEVLAEAKKRHPGWKFMPAAAGARIVMTGGQRRFAATCPSILPVVHEGGAVTYTLLGEKL